MTRALRIAAWAWLIAGGLVLLHGVATGRGVVGAVFGWELDHGGTVWPIDTDAALVVALVVAPCVLLILGYRSDAPRVNAGRADPAQAIHVAKGAAFIGVTIYVLAGLAFARTLLLPDFDAPAVDVVLDRISAGQQIAEGQAIVVGIAQFGFMVHYEEANGGGRTSIRRRIHRFVPMTNTDWRLDQSVRILTDLADQSVRDSASGDRREPRSSDTPRSVTSHGMLLAGQVPGFVRAVFERKGLVLSPDVLVQTTDRGAGRDDWYVAAAILGLAGFVSMLTAAVAFATVRRRTRRP